MHVLHVLPSLDPLSGGPARSVPDLCQALSRLGVQVSLYSFGRDSTDAETASLDESRVQEFSLRLFSPLRGSRQAPSPTFWRRLSQEIGNFDLVHLHSLWNPAISLAARVCRREGVPYVISPRGMLHRKARGHKSLLKSLYYCCQERQTLQGAAGFHFFSHADSRQSEQLLPKGSYIFIIPNGIDPALDRSVSRGRFRQANPQLWKKRFMVYLGRLDSSKNLSVQARALHLLVQDFPDLIWVLVGPDTGYWSSLRQLIHSLGLEQHVLWTGYLPHARGLEALVDADVFVLTSLHEAHSCAMNEALALGTPVVLTDSVQFNALEEWGAGKIAASNPADLAAAVGAVLADSQERNRAQSAGLRLVTERLAWSTVANQMILAYQAVLENNRLLLPF